MRAIRYALSIGASEVWAVHAAVDQENQEALIERWMALRLPVPLVVIECWDRNVARSLEQHVLEPDGTGTEVTVVMPRRDFPSPPAAPARPDEPPDRPALGRYEHVDIAVVPYHVGEPEERTPEDARGVDAPSGPQDDAVPAGRLP